ncbi:MAG: hypothetical protein ABIO43_11660 [Sphingomicrobium sp.]
MTFAHLFAFLSSLLTPGGAGQVAQSRAVSQVTIQEQLIVRVPVQSRPQRFEWEEHKGPKCIATSDIRGAKLSGPQQVDLMLRDHSRIRAKFDDDCPALDFYEGFYLKPEDENLCAKRDSVRSRMGGSCRIEKFRRLTPKDKR